MYIKVKYTSIIMDDYSKDLYYLSDFFQMMLMEYCGGNMRYNMNMLFNRFK